MFCQDLLPASGCQLEGLQPFQCHRSAKSALISLHTKQCYGHVQALQDAAAIDAKASSGSAITPLCGLPLAVKDAIDVEG